MGISYIDPRKPGEVLWPSKYSPEEMSRRKAGVGEYDFAALYQQQPTPSGGGLFKQEWFKNRYVDVAPVLARRARGWDTASKENGGDWTAGVLIAEAGGLFYVEDVVWGQWTPGQVDAMMQTTSEMDGKLIAQREEREGGSAGQTVIDARIKTLVGVNYAGVPITGSKVVRSTPFRVQCEAGNVFIVRDRGVGGKKRPDGTYAGWNQDYVRELMGFPTGKHDDVVDASTCAFNAVLLEPEPIVKNRATW